MGGGGNFTSDDKPEVQAPTLGRVVHVITPDRDVALAGTVAYVHDGSDSLMVNIGALDEQGRPIHFTSVPHRDSVNPDHVGAIAWIWPPRV